MPRKARDLSEIDVYHVGLKGNNDQIVFYDDEDRAKFVESLFFASAEFKVGLAAWVLMSNHVHFLLHGESSDFAKMIESFSARYVQWVNKKHERHGKLFSGRYYSKAVNTSAEYVQTVAYIFNNPVAASMIEEPQDYEWSNFKDLIDGNDKPAIKLVSLFSTLEEIVRVTQQGSKKKLSRRAEESIEVFPIPRVTDDEILSILKTRFSEEEICKIPEMQENIQRALVEELFDAGSNVNQISRVTGLSRRKLSYL